MIDIDFDSLESITTAARQESLAREFQNASPFPHVVIDDFVSRKLLELLVADFPNVQDADFSFDEGIVGARKHSTRPDRLDPTNSVRRFAQFLNSATFLNFLEVVTGMRGLISDPYFHGAGCHETMSGGSLGLHVDSRILGDWNLARRLNFILYLNPTWIPEWGGSLEFWEPSGTAAVKEVQPIGGRAVIFATDHRSYHGHPHPLQCPNEISRRSLATYYFTAGASDLGRIPHRSTNYMRHPDLNEVGRLGLRMINFRQNLRDWIPPVIARAISRSKD